MGRAGPGSIMRPGAYAVPWALLALALAAWLAIAAWGASPEARWLDHAWQPATTEDQLLAAAAFATGWTLMVTAMMLPSAGALLRAFGTATRSRDDSARLRVLVAFGFLGIWLLVGCAFQLFDRGVHATVERTPFLESHPGLLAGGALLLAGSFQFTDLKRRCLTACRMPQGFVYRHWGAGRPWRDALNVGAAYGRSCAGCCWALMLVAFALGMANLAWMFVLAAVTTAEKAGLAGPLLVHATGAVLLVAGVMVAIG